MSEDCLFCGIAAGKIPSKKVYEDDEVYAFMDINPVHEGHTLIIPKKHRTFFSELTSSEVAKMFEIAQKLTKQIRENDDLKSTLKSPTANNLMIFDGEDSGQEVFHTHLHIIPRHKKDGAMKLRTFGQKCPKFGSEECKKHMDVLGKHAEELSKSLK